MNRLIEIQTTENSKIALPIIEYQGKKVITTELLAQLYGTDAKVIRNNFDRNKERFTQNIHYIKLTGANLIDFINALKSNNYNLQTSLGDLQISSKTRTLYLWTEEGCIRHAKILQTDQAWHVFGLLEKAYFQQLKEEPIVKENSLELELKLKIQLAELELRKIETELIKTKIACAERLADRIISNFPNLSESSKQQLLAHAYSTVTQSEHRYLLPLVTKKTFSATELAEKYGKSPQAFGRILNQLNLKQPEFSECRVSKSKYNDKQIEQYFYFESVLSILDTYFQK